MAEDESYSCGWRRPDELQKIRKMKTKKRALQTRYFDVESPSKKLKHSHKQQVDQQRLYFKAKPPPPDEETCDSNDSTLMDLLNLKQGPSTSTPLSMSKSREQSPNFASAFTVCYSPSYMTSPPKKLTSKNEESAANSSPLRKYLPSYSSIQETPKNLRKRQALIPAPAPTSPSWSNNSRDGVNETLTPPKIYALDDSTRQKKLKIVKIAAAEQKLLWHKELCLDWSLKTRLLVTCSRPFGWSSNGLKTSEESSGISAFVRCIDIEPGDANSPHTSQLDTSLGAQFHQCCLYWQHPYLPTVNLFPREHTSISNALNGISCYTNIRFEEKVFDNMLCEWIEAFRSAFQLLRTRQCPFFYVCANQFTSLFCAAGTQGSDQIQIFVTPSTKGFRDALKSEGIDFILPYCTQNASKADENDSKNDPPELSDNEKDNDSDDEPNEWLNQIGISKDLNLSTCTKTSPSEMMEEKNRSSLVIISGSNSLSFFNFLINSKTFLVSSIGPFAGLPPTILGPVAFHGATLRSLKVKQIKVKNDKGSILHSIEMSGPILPHAMHMLCALLSKTVEEYKINISTISTTTTLNLNSKQKNTSEKCGKPNVFEMQNLSDCGLKKAILEVFCRSDNCETVKDSLLRQNSLFQWS